MKKLLLKIMAWMLKIEQDKWLHLLFGLVIAQLTMLLPMTLGARCIAAVCAVTIVELCKECLIDSQLDWLDVLFTEIGCAIGVGLTCLTIVCL